MSRTMLLLLGLLSLVGMVGDGLSSRAQDTGDSNSAWRRRRPPRIEQPPDPASIRVTPSREGWATIIGKPGSAVDKHANLVRIVNLNSGDEMVAGVRPDRSFRGRMFAPPGSTLQINSIALPVEALQEGLRERILRSGWSSLEREMNLDPGMIGNAKSSSPGIMFRVQPSSDGRKNKSAFIRRVGSHLWTFGKARMSSSRAQPGDTVEAQIEFNVVWDSNEFRPELKEPPWFEPTLFCLFDGEGRERPHGRILASNLLTPTGLPIEGSDMMSEAGPDERERRWHPGPSGMTAHSRPLDRGRWRQKGKMATVTQRYEFEIPRNAPHGHYGVAGYPWGVEEREFDAGEPANKISYLGFLKIGNPKAPKLTCMLLGSVASEGSRGTLSREDRKYIAINPNNVFMPDKLIIPRDDAYTGEPVVYPLDPYVPLLSMSTRPVPVAPALPIPFDFTKSRLTIRVEEPNGRTRTLGPAPLFAAVNDLSVIRPDLVVPGRIVPGTNPSYGNPSMSEIVHLTGQGKFHTAFKEYGRHVIRIEGSIPDRMGTRYAISGTYDVHVARQLDIEPFPRFGTPLYPGVEFTPQLTVQPAMPAEVEMRWRHYPYSDPERMVERKIVGRANRWGIFVPGEDVAPVKFRHPGEYVFDVTVRHKDSNGDLWMASRRGASVVVTPDSKIVVHGERGNRSPEAKWRARWFVAGNGGFVTEFPKEAEEPIIDLGHTCYPYHSGDVAWLGHQDPFSFLPNLTFEDPEGTVADLIEKRWAAIREGEGRGGLYPDSLRPEDRRAIGELPFVCMTSSGLPPALQPKDVDMWGYFYNTSWRPGLGVRSQVSEDTLPAHYWFFDDPYGMQLGAGPLGDLAGDVKMNYGAGVFRHKSSGITFYGAYASMLVLIDERDRRGPRVLPPFDGLVPGSPKSGPLIDIGGKEFDVFLSFGAVGPGTILEAGERLSVTGVVWPPVSGHVEAKIVSPSGKALDFRSPSTSMGTFQVPGSVALEPGVWIVDAEGVCSGKTSVGVISELVPEEKWPRGGGLGLSETEFPVIVVRKDAPPITFDLPRGSRANPPRALVIRGRLPKGTNAEYADVLVKIPGVVIDRQRVKTKGGTFEYVYDPRSLKRRFTNIDLRSQQHPDPNFQGEVAWFDTVTFSFWAGKGGELRAGTVLLQGEDIYAQARSGKSMPRSRWLKTGNGRERKEEGDERRPIRSSQGTPHSSLLALSRDGKNLFAGHPWSGEVVRLQVRGARLSPAKKTRTGGKVEALALSPDGTRVYAALGDRGQVVALKADSLREVARFNIQGIPRGVLALGNSIYVADFDGDRIIRLDARTGEIESTSDRINRPAALAASPDGHEIYTTSFRTGEIVVLDRRCDVKRRLKAPSQLNQCRTLTLGPDGLLYAPQTRSDTVVGGLVFDRTVFPVVAVADPQGKTVSIGYHPDLVVIPPHRPVEVAVDSRYLYLASAGSDDVVAIDRKTGFAKWHAKGVGKEPGGLLLDTARRQMYVLTVTGQEIVTLDERSGKPVSRVKFTRDPTPEKVARGRYLFGTATDKRLTKDQWVSCASCHPFGEADGRQWNLGLGPQDTSSLRGSLESAPLHVIADIDEIQDLYHLARMRMGGQWFVPREAMNDYLGKSNAGLDGDLDALAAYVASLKVKKTAEPPRGSRERITKGKRIFSSAKANCVKCHSGPRYTDSGTRQSDGTYLLHDVGTWLPTEGKRLKYLDTPSLLGLRRTEPYLHDGRAKTVEEIFSVYNQKDQHGRTSHLSPEEIEDLAEFLRYLRPD